jgi:hypothetical protein
LVSNRDRVSRSGELGLVPPPLAGEGTHGARGLDMFQVQTDIIERPAASA